MYDLLLKGGQIIDGTGAPARVADVAIKDGRIADLGRVNEGASRVIDVSGLTVAPGFVDIHTHYDAQVLWDGAATPSCLHGFTTVVGGNCGFTIAPMQPRDVEYVAGMLAHVEDIPLESLYAGLDWNWTSFGSWLDRLDGRVAINVGFLAGHSTLRRVVMGSDAVGSKARPDDIARMASLLHECLSQGAMGFSSSAVDAHVDGDKKPVPSRFAEQDELFELARVTGEHPGTVLSYAPGTPGVFGDRQVATMIGMSRLANRSLNWNNLRIQSEDPSFADKLLDYGTRAAKEGAHIAVLTFPDTTLQLVTLKSSRIWSSLSGWADVILQSREKRLASLKDPAVRNALREGARPDRDSPSPIMKSLARWETLIFSQLALPQHAALRGRRVGDVARERGQDPLDTLLDVAVAENLNTYFEMTFEADGNDKVWRQRARVWRDPRAVLGASDAGAHLDQICGYRYATSLLGKSVRERELLTAEEAVRLISDVPARYYGLRGRGRIARGWQADLTVFDLARIDYQPLEMRNDLPGGASRLYCGADGMEFVFVNGTDVVVAGQCTGKSPGTVLRSYRDIETRPARQMN